MQKINKKSPIPEFSNLMSQKNKPKVWDDVPSDVRFKMKCFMLSCEQNNLCGYTELPLKNDNSHIDHFKKRNMFPKLTFVWDNFVIASIDEEFGAKFKDNHSNLTKKDYNIIYNPVVRGMENVVWYDKDGKMYPNDNNDVGTMRTIEIFNLNHKSLKQRRKEIIKQVDEYFKCGCSNEDIKEILQQSGFPSVIEWELNQLKEVY